MVVEGVRYVQWPVGNPSEHKQEPFSGSTGQVGGLMCLWDSSDGEAPEHWTAFGRHYAEYERL